MVDVPYLFQVARTRERKKKCLYVQFLYIEIKKREKYIEILT